MKRERRRTANPKDESARLPETPVDAVDEFVEGKRPTVLGPKDEDDPGLAWEQGHPTEEEKSRRGRIRGFQRQGGSLAPSNGHRGSAASWACVALAVAGFSLGGLAIVLDWSIPLLVAGGILMAAAAVVAVVFDILSDVVLDPPRHEAEEPHQTPLHRIKREEET